MAVMGAEVVVFVWDSTYGAFGALADLRRHHADAEWLDHLAVVERHRSGRVATHTTHGSVVEGAAWGALAGGLVGMLFGPAGVLLGAAAAGAAGAALEDVVKETGLPENLLADVRRSLEKQSSALVFVGHTDEAEVVVSAVDELAPDGMVRHGISEQALVRIEESISL